MAKKSIQYDRFKFDNPIVKEIIDTFGSEGYFIFDFVINQLIIADLKNISNTQSIIKIISNNYKFLEQNFVEKVIDYCVINFIFEKYLDVLGYKIKTKQFENNISAKVLLVYNYYRQVTGYGGASIGEVNFNTIKSALIRGYSVQQLNDIVLWKKMQWEGKDLVAYLKPSTLFSKKHLETYTNEVEIAKRNEKIYNEKPRNSEATMAGRGF